MALTVVNLTQPMNNGANSAAVKAWGSAISSLFSGAGLVQTADTGQINWTTATPTYNVTNGSDTLIGYEVWAFNDSLQATKPVILRVEYRNGYFTTGAINYAYILIDTGTQTNGSGTVTGTFSGFQVRLSPAGSTPWSGTLTAFSSGDGSSLALAIAPTATGASTANIGAGMYYIDRTRDSSGAITGEGAVFGSCGYQNRTLPAPLTADVANSGWFITYSFGTPTVRVEGSATVANQGTVLPSTLYDNTVSGTTIGMDAPTQVVNQKVLPPILAALAYPTSNIAQGTTVTVPVSGTDHTYYCLGTFAACANRHPGNSTMSLALRYE